MCLTPGVWMHVLVRKSERCLLVLAIVGPYGPIYNGCVCKREEAYSVSFYKLIGSVLGKLKVEDIIYIYKKNPNEYQTDPLPILDNKT